MSIYGTGDATKYWRVPLANGSGDSRPFTISAWVWSDGSSPVDAVAMASVPTTAQAAVLFLVSGAQVVASEYDGSTWAPATSTPPGGFMTGWRHVAGVFSGGSLRQTWYDGTAGATDTSTIGAVTYTALSVGLFTPGGTNPTTIGSKIAEIAYFDRALDVSELRSLAQGSLPLRIGGLRHYFPLRNNLLGRGPSPIGLTPIGGAVALYGDHPRVDPLPTQHSMTFLAAAATQPPPSANTSPTIWWT